MSETGKPSKDEDLTGGQKGKRDKPEYSLEDMVSSLTGMPEKSPEKSKKKISSELMEFVEEAKGQRVKPVMKNLCSTAVGLMKHYDLNIEDMGEDLYLLLKELADSRINEIPECEEKYKEILIHIFKIMTADTFRKNDAETKNNFGLLGAFILSREKKLTIAKQKIASLKATAKCLRGSEDQYSKLWAHLSLKYDGACPLERYGYSLGKFPMMVINNMSQRKTLFNTNVVQATYEFEAMMFELLDYRRRVILGQPESKETLNKAEYTNKDLYDGTTHMQYKKTT